MSLRLIRRIGLALCLQLTTMGVVASSLASCTTTSQKDAKKQSSKKKKKNDSDKFKSYDLYSNKDLNPRILEQGQREMSGAAFDSL